MKLTIKVATNLEKVLLSEETIDFPTEDTFYIENEGDYTETIFAFIVKYFNETNISYNILKIKSNSQKHTDFIPTNDCYSEFWLTSQYDDIRLRKEFLELLKPRFGTPKTISREEFEVKRMKLLNNWQNKY